MGNWHGRGRNRRDSRSDDDDNTRGSWPDSTARAWPVDVPLLYGGSVTPDNVAEFASQPNVNGALVGGASLNAESFVAIAKGMAGG